MKESIEKQQSKEFIQKESFKQCVKALVAHEHEHRYSYTSSFRAGENKTLTVVYNRPHSYRNIQIPNQYMAFMVEKVNKNGYEIYVKESYFANGFIGIHYDVSIASYKDLKGQRVQLANDSGEPENVYLDNDIPEEVKMALFEKISGENQTTSINKIDEIIKLMKNPDNLTKIKEKRGHVHWHLLRKDHKHSE